MATIGLDKLYYAKITEDADGNETYAAPKSLAKAMTADLSVELAEAFFTVFQEIHSLFGRHGLNSLKLFRNSASVILEFSQTVLAEFFPVCLFEHINNNAADFLQVFTLLFPVNIVLCPKESRIRIPDFRFSHQFLPPFFWIRLISSDSTNAWNLVRS